MESLLNSRQRSIIQDEAADWFLARQEGMDPARTRQFTDWLATSPVHLAEYHAMERLGRGLRHAIGSAAPVEELVERMRLADDEDGTVIAFSPRGRARTRARHLTSTWAVAAVFAFVAVAVVVLWPTMKDLVVPQAHEWSYASSRGQVLVQPLQDGSVLTLDTDSAVIVRYDQNGRQVQLQRGRVLFNVVHDELVPFVVWAGPARVEDVGTKFDVYRMPGGVTRVTVLEGRVEVSRDSSDGIPGTRQLGANEQLDVEPGQPLGESIKVNAEQAMSWSRGSIRFEGKSVKDSAAEVSRYSVRRIEVESEKLGNEPIYYTFRTDNVDDFLEFLGSQLGARRQEEPERIVLTRP